MIRFLSAVAVTALLVAGSVMLALGWTVVGIVLLLVFAVGAFVILR